MNDLGKQVCKCIVGACDDTCKYYDAEKSCCVGYEEVVQQAEKVFSEYESYKDLEEQNRLLKLPCAVGDTVYIVKGGEVLRNYVVQIHIAQVEAQTFFSCYDDCFGIEQIGKTVFLTREESEAALKELDRGKGE